MKYIRNNEGPFMNKILRKAIMNRTRLLNKFRAKQNCENKSAYKKQRNACVNLLRKAKKSYYNNLNVKSVTDNKLFWKNVKPGFSEKMTTYEKITLIENDKIVSKDDEVAQTFNEFFANVVQNLNLKPPADLIQNADHIDDPIFKAIHKYELHPSVIKIKEKMTEFNFHIFSFKKLNENEMKKQICSLKSSKAQQPNDIPTQLIKENIDIFCPFITKNFNFCLDNFEFPSILKYANVTPAHKKGTKTNVKNYRPISILPNLSKAYERSIYNQLYEYFDNILSKYQFGYRKGYSAQQCLISMIEQFKSCLDRGNLFGAILTDLSKAFDCIPYDLLIAKLSAYGLDLPSLRLLNSYLSDRKQRVKINNTFSIWSEVLCGVPQGSILGPLLFNIFICDLFLFITTCDIASYADDNSPYYCGRDINNVLQNLTKVTEQMFTWFENNGMKVNPEKSHLILSHPYEKETFISGELIENSKCEKLLGVLIDHKLTFDKHVRLLCNKASTKVNALARISQVMEVGQRKLIMNAFIISHFSYCPLVWMMHSRRMNDRINRIHKRALRIVYKDYKSSFAELLARDGSLTIHQRNLKLLATEVFKAKNNIGPEITSDIFRFVEPAYNLRHEKAKSIPIRTVHYGTETLTYLGPKFWKHVPDQCKSATSLSQFKIAIKKWIPENCPCRICKTYIQGVGFI